MRTSVVLVRDGREVARWPLELRRQPDIGLVDDLARLQLAVRRVGMTIRLDPVAPELARVLLFAGLASSFRCGRRCSEAAASPEPTHEPEDQQHE